jgi:hypothetical protein
MLEIPNSVLTLRSRTRRLYLTWWATHYAVGLCGVIAGALLTALTSAHGGKGAGPLAALDSWAWLIGILAAVCTSLVTFLGPIHKAERYWSAYHILDQACLEYEQGEITLKRFLTSTKQARRILQAVGDDGQESAAAVKDLHREAQREEAPLTHVIV